MKIRTVPATALAAAVVLLLVFTPRAAHSQVIPTSGAMLSIDGTVGATVVHRKIYDSQIHTGNVRSPAGNNTCSAAAGDDVRTDAYVLQGGSPTGCDPGDGFETTQGTGTATISAAGYSFAITTFYTFGPQCNSNGTICVGGESGNPDTGFLTVTNNSGSNFTGTITLSGTSPIGGDPFCPPGGVASDSISGTLTAVVPADPASWTFALSKDSSNCGGFNQSQKQTLAAGGTLKFLLGDDEYDFAAVNNVGGEQITFLPVPILRGSFNPGALFQLQTCSAYADFSATGETQNLVCPEFHLSCAQGTANTNDCGTFLYQATTHFAFPAGFARGFPSFLKADGASCPPANGFNQNIILKYASDPSLDGGSGGTSCFAAAFASGTTEPDSFTAPFYTSSLFSPIANPPVFNIRQAGAAVPTIFQLLTPSNQFVTPSANGGLLYCIANPPSTAACAEGTVFIQWVSTACPNAAAPAQKITPAMTTGHSGLTFNDANNTWQYNVKTPKSFAGTCQVLEVVFPLGIQDGSPLPPITRTALFQFH